MSEDAAEIKRALWAHIAPFAAWLILMEVLPAAAWSYAARSAVVAALILYFRPWRWYAGVRIRHLPAAFVVGVTVFVLWVLPESAALAKWPALQSAYLRVAILPPWELYTAPPETLYAPEVCGWPLAIARLLGSALVIAVAEEFFWRGFLYRWLVSTNFLGVDPGCFRLVPFLAAGLVFGLEHNRWLAGLLAGLAYGGLMIRTRNVWAASVAHAVTNFLLGLYVLATGSYGFW